MIAGEVLADGLKREKVAGRASADGQKCGRVSGIDAFACASRMIEWNKGEAGGESVRRFG